VLTSSGCVSAFPGQKVAVEISAGSAFRPLYLLQEGKASDLCRFAVRGAAGSDEAAAMTLSGIVPEVEKYIPAHGHPRLRPVYFEEIQEATTSSEKVTWSRGLPVHRSRRNLAGQRDESETGLRQRLLLRFHMLR